MSGSVEKYTLKDGSTRWMVRYRTAEGVQKKSKGHQTKRAATLYLPDVQVKQATGTWVDPLAGKVTIGSLYDTWLAAQGHAKAPQTELGEARRAAMGAGRDRQDPAVGGAWLGHRTAGCRGRCADY